MTSTQTCLKLSNRTRRTTTNDKDMTSAPVQGKRKAAKRWVRYVNADEQTTDTWHYLLVSETDTKTAKGDWDALKRIAGA
jgi:hypothetical protein